MQMDIKQDVIPVSGTSDEEGMLIMIVKRVTVGSKGTTVDAF